MILKHFKKLFFRTTTKPSLSWWLKLNKVPIKFYKLLIKWIQKICLHSENEKNKVPCVNLNCVEIWNNSKFLLTRNIITYLYKKYEITDWKKKEKWGKIFSDSNRFFYNDQLNTSSSLY